MNNCCSIFSTILCILLVLNSCQREPIAPIDSSLLYVSEDNVGLAAFHLSILQNVTSKKDILVKDSTKAPSNILTNLLNISKAKGIDYNRNSYIYFQQKADKFTSLFPVLLLPVKDSALFEQYIQPFNVLTLEKKKDYRLAQLDSKISIAWNNEVAFLYPPSENDWVDDVFKKEGLANIAGSENLAICLQDQSDLKIWLNSNVIAKHKSVHEATLLLDIPKNALINNFIHTHIDIKDQSIQGKSGFFINKGISQDLDLLFKTKPAKDLQSLFPQEHLTGIISTAFDSKGIRQLMVEKPQIMMAVPGFMKQYGISLEDLLLLFSGEIIYATYQFDQGTTAQFAAQINDIELLDNILQKLINQDLITPLSKDRYQLGTIFSNQPSEPNDSLASFVPKILIQNDQLIITDAPQLYDQLDQATDYLPSNQLSNTNLFSTYFGTDLFAQNYDPTFLSIQSIQMKVDRKNASFKIDTPSGKKLVRQIIQNLFIE